MWEGNGLNRIGPTSQSERLRASRAQPTADAVWHFRVSRSRNQVLRAFWDDIQSWWGVVSVYFFRVEFGGLVESDTLITPISSNPFGIRFGHTPTVWANNGDMISREYAGTSALKGDFTRYVLEGLCIKLCQNPGSDDHRDIIMPYCRLYRTGKRNITGMVNDASNSLARIYHNTVRDFWRQVGSFCL